MLRAFGRCFRGRLGISEQDFLVEALVELVAIANQIKVIFVNEILPSRRGKAFIVIKLCITAIWGRLELLRCHSAAVVRWRAVLLVQINLSLKGETYGLDDVRGALSLFVHILYLTIYKLICSLYIR